MDKDQEEVVVVVHEEDVLVLPALVRDPAPADVLGPVVLRAQRAAVVLSPSPVQSLSQLKSLVPDHALGQSEYLFPNGFFL